jgi:hypothetical protein
MVSEFTLARCRIKNAFPAFMTPGHIAAMLIDSTHLSHDDGTTSVPQICSVVQIVHSSKILILVIYYIIQFK